MGCKGEWTNLNRKSCVRNILGVLCLILFLSFPFYSKINNYLSIPNEIVTFEKNPSLSIPNMTEYTTHIPSSQFASKEVSSQREEEQSNQSIVYKKGDIPLKKVDLSILKDKKIIPGGQSIGVKLHTLGVLVVGHHLVTSNGETESPGEDANIKVGDVILEMDGKKIKKLEDVKPIVSKAGKNNKEIMMKIKRGKETIETKLAPAINKHDQSYQIGLYIRDSTTGIGTISFYDEETGKYGALGHVISDSDTNKPIDLYKGKLVQSKITAIEKGDVGVPGEKQAEFSMNDEALGTITKNSPYGIFGKLNTDALKNNASKPMEIGLAHEVEKGPAEILTVIDGEKVEKFTVDIVSSKRQESAATKGMVVKVTDERLLKETGGIVQGMSGSPIIQNNKIIGAVTHVFVNDPTSGYGVHIEWMLDEADIDIYENEASSIFEEAV